MAAKVKERKLKSTERRWQVGLGSAELDAIAFLRGKFGKDLPEGSIAATSVVRLSLREQAIRDDKKTSGLVGVYKEMAEAVAEKAKAKGVDVREGRKVEALKPWSMKLLPVDRKNLEFIQKTHALRYESEALRFAVRVQAHIAGFRVK